MFLHKNIHLRKLFIKNSFKMIGYEILLGSFELSKKAEVKSIIEETENISEVKSRSDAFQFYVKT